MGENSLTRFTVLFQATVWQKSRVSDHRAALMAVLGAASTANLLPVQHRQEQPEVSDALRKHGQSYGFQRERWGSSAQLAWGFRSFEMGEDCCFTIILQSHIFFSIHKKEKAE